MQFSHLHVHTQYSLLDGAANIKGLINKAAKDNMPALAITDHGNMFGVFEFVNECNKAKIKPIVGCEFYLVEDRHKKQFTKEQRDRRFHQLLLAKNEEGYKNLSRLCSLGYTEGFYSKYPRIDKEILLKHHTGLIATTCCIGAEVPQAILNKSEEEAEEVFKWWLDIFQEDYYIELQRHAINEQQKINEVLLRFAKKYNVKTIATNDSHYIDQQDSTAHDILLCVNTGDKKSTPIATDEEGGKGYRFGFPNDQFYFKTTEEMSALFHDVPESIDNTNEIVDKVNSLNLTKDILLPNYVVPNGFSSQVEYLEHITWQGAKERYKEITSEIEDRIKFELFTINTMGFPGYFLIVADFIKAGREMGVFVGPGRGSAAGSVVAYCIGITNIDPIKYGLLFERFLNPERKSMPDIDTDLDDVGRQKVIDYVVEKYGRNQVAQIVTFGTMAAKSAIKDVARVLDLPLNESNALAKLVPDKLTSLKRALHDPLESGQGSLKEKEGLQKEDIDNLAKLREHYEKHPVYKDILREAEKLEGSVRSTGIHAAGIIIAPEELVNIIPVCTSKDSPYLVTQVEGNIIESSGVIKMDFLGLKTLTILKSALELIKQRRGVDIDLDTLPLDDVKTYELFQRGDTVGIFQFESPGMQKHMRDLKPNQFEDLIAMNALYRPGPIAYIPNYIKRKHGLEPISYDLPAMEETLKETYGITVYQEQVMLLSQKLAGFSKGKADELRKAMGKKIKAKLDELKPMFIEGCKTNGHNTDKAEKIWKDWEAFASYAFNKSHSTCYALVAYQTAFLKANYPQEFMAAVLNHASSLEKITFFMEECQRMGIKVQGPDINESFMGFAVNSQNEIRFGLSGLKGVGQTAAEEIIRERSENGLYKDFFDVVKRVNLRIVNKRSLESLAYGGAFDSFEPTHRAQYFSKDTPESNEVFIDKAIKFGQNAQNNKQSSQASLFGDMEEDILPNPIIPKCEPWSHLERLKFEKEVLGIYLSGHPLDQFRFEMKNFTNCTLAHFKDPAQLVNRELKLGAIVTKTFEGVSKNGNRYGSISLQDMDGDYDLRMYGEDYLRFKKFFVSELFLFIEGRFELRRNTDNFYDFRVSSIILLSDAREKCLQNISLSINTQSITPDLMEELCNYLLSSPGKTPVELLLIDNETGYEVMTKVRKNRINVDHELIKAIEKMDGVKYLINSRKKS
jgi:DNA polymerase III subunit alpha